LVELLLPRTDAGVAVQLVLTLVTGVPLFVWLRRRRLTEQAWLVGGVITFLLGFFAFRTVH